MGRNLGALNTLPLRIEVTGMYRIVFGMIDYFEHFSQTWYALFNSSNWLMYIYLGILFTTSRK